MAPQGGANNQPDALLEAILTAPEPQAPAGRPADVPLEGRVLQLWLSCDRATGPDRKGRFVRWLNRQIARLDDLINRTVNSILHHPRFQRLEASWRGLHYLVGLLPED